MDIVVPVFKSEGIDSIPVCALFFLINPEFSFYPLIQTWPTPSKTSETLLVEKCDGSDSIVYLNKLRHRENTALNLKISLKDTILPAVKAVLGRTGIFDALDYRGIEVLAISKKIKGTSWYMITKTDMSEVQEPLKNKTKWFLILIGLMVLLAGVTSWTFWNRRKTKQYKQLYTAIAEKNIAENKFHLFFENSPVGKSITSIDGSIQVNKAFCEMLGYSKDELNNKKFRDITHPEDIAFGDKVVEDLLAGKESKIHFTKRYFHKNGSIVWGSINTTLQRNENGKPLFFMTSVNDITESKRIEAEQLRLLHILESSLNEIYIFDSNHLRFQYVNNGALLNLGYSAEDMQQMTPIDIKPEFTETSFRKAIEPLLKHELEQYIFTTVHRRKDGSLYDVEAHLQLVEYENQRVFLAVILDITNRKKAEETLKISEERYRNLLTNLEAGVVVHAPDTSIIMNNKRASKLLGLSDDQMKGRLAVDPYWKFVDEEKNPLPLEEYPVNKAIATKQSFKNRVLGVIKSEKSDIVWLSVNGLPMLDSNGEIIEVQISFIDITEIKKAEENLINTFKLLDTYIASMYAGILTVSAEGNVKNINKAFCDIFELSEPPETYIGLASPDMIAKIKDVYETPDITLERIREIVAQRKPVIGEVINLRNKQTYLVDFIPVDINGQNCGHIWHHQDITKLKQAESALNASEQKFRLFFENSAIGKSITEIDGTAHVNKALCNTLGYSENEMLNVNFRDITYPDDIAETEKLIADMVSGKSDQADYTKRYLHKNGSIVWCEVHSTIQRDDKHNPLFLTTSILDITERKKLEDAVKESEEKYRQLFTEMTSAFALHRIINNENGEAIDYEFIEINPAFENLTGLIAKDICGKTVKEIMPDTEDIWIKNYGKVANEGIQMSFANYSRELDRHYNVYAYCPKKGYFAVIFNDITEQQKASDKINMLNNDLEEKNAELERLIFVASHDLRSPLVNIQGFGGELKSLYKEVKRAIAEENDISILHNKLATILDSDIPESLNFIELSAQKMNQLISGMLKVSRIGRTDILLTTVNMNQLISQVLSTFEFTIKTENIIIKVESLPDCLADKILIDQLFTNLIGNSIKFRNHEKQAQISISGYTDEHQVVYCIEDNGIGFSEKYMDKIFLLFHRLNNNIDGEGLGLSIVKKIVDLHKGRVWAESEVNKGSKFFVALGR
jgi:PAS domain S-box-containing protein